MDFQSFKKAVIAKAEALGITEYELYYQSEESTSVSAFQHEMNQFTASTEGGVTILRTGSIAAFEEKNGSLERINASRQRVVDFLRFCRDAGIGRYSPHE